MDTNLSIDWTWLLWIKLDLVNITSHIYIASYLASDTDRGYLGGW